MECTYTVKILIQQSSYPKYHSKHLNMQAYINTSFKNWNKNEKKSSADASMCFSAKSKPWSLAKPISHGPTGTRKLIIPTAKEEGTCEFPEKVGIYIFQPQKCGFGFPVTRICRVDASYWNSIGIFMAMFFI